MHNWERLILYRKKLVLPRIYQLVDWFSWISCVFAILFLGALVYRFGFSFTDDMEITVNRITKIVWIVFLINTTLSHLFSNENSGKFTVWTWILDISLYLTLLPVVFNEPEPGNFAYWIWTALHSHYYRSGVLLLMSFTIYQIGGLFV